jgi:hypothetical protein
VYGWKLNLVTTVAAVGIRLAADLTSANVADNVHTPLLLKELPTELRFLLGDKTYHDPDLQQLRETSERVLVTTQRDRSPHDDAGGEVRRSFHRLRSRAIENFNEQFKGIFHGPGQVRTRGRVAARRFVLRAVFVDQLALLHRSDTHAALRVGLKPFLQAA